MALNSTLALALMVTANTSAASEAMDKFSKTFDARIKRMSSHSDKLITGGLVNLEVGKSVGRALLEPIKDFATLEQASLSLKASMMDAAGNVPKTFNDLNKLAVKLGNKLPGTTADMFELFKTMINNGAKAENVLNGTGKAAAYLAIGLNIPFTEAGEMAQRMKIATGISDQYLLQFMDIINRVSKLGISVQDFTMFVGRTSGVLKILGVQGIKSSKDIGALSATLIKTMQLGGETVGTALSRVMMNFLDTKRMSAFNKELQGLGINITLFDKKTQKFLGIKNMMVQMNKLKDLTGKQKSSLARTLGLRQGASAAAFFDLTTGLNGFNEQAKQMADRASLVQQVNIMLGSLKNTWENFIGTMENTMAAFGEKNKKALKNLINALASIFIWIAKLANKHSTITKSLMGIIGLFTLLSIVTGVAKIALGTGIKNLIGFYKGIKKIYVWAKLAKGTVGTAFLFMKDRAGAFSEFMVGKAVPKVVQASRLMGGGMVKAFKGVGKAFSVLGKLIAANWVILAIIAIAVAAYLIIKNWAKIKAFFIKLWGWIKKIFLAAWEWIKRMFLNYTPYGLVIKNWSKITAWFKRLWDKVKDYFSAAWEWIKGMFMKYSLPGIIISHWSAISTFFSNLWDGIKKKFMAFVGWFTSKWDWINKHIIQPVANWFGGGDSNVNVVQSAAGIGRQQLQLVPVRSGSNDKFIYNPTITIHGNADQATINKLVADQRRHFENQMKDYQYNKNRKSVR